MSLFVPGAKTSDVTKVFDDSAKVQKNISILDFFKKVLKVVLLKTKHRVCPVMRKI